MSVVPALLLCSLGLVAAAVALFVWSAKQGDCQDAERLCLLPLDDDTAGTADPDDLPRDAADDSAPGAVAGARPNERTTRR